MDAQALQRQLVELEARGARRRAPLPFLVAKSLSARLGSAAPEVQALLGPRVEAALADCEARLAQRRPLRPAAAARAPRSALGELVDSLARGSSEAIPGGAPAELASAARFRRAWARQEALDRAALAHARKPANAGPLNSHAIALECLGLMQKLSPDYLRHFMVQVEALQALEQCQAELPPGATPGKPTQRRPATREVRKKGGPLR